MRASTEAQRPDIGASAVNSRAEAALAKLDAIEAEMRRIGYWTANPPDLRAEVSAGRIKSFLDAPSFELWLQCIFLPNARDAARENSFPDRSQVGLIAMRQYDYHSHVPEAQGLLGLLSEFDEIVEGSERVIVTGTQAVSDDPRRLDPQDSQFGGKVCELFQVAERGGTGSLAKKLALLTYLVENELAPALPGAVKFHPEPVQMFSLVSLYMDDPQAIGLLPAVCEFEVAKYPEDSMTAASAEALMRSIKAMLEGNRKDPAEAERDWQAGQQWWPEAHAEREKAHALFRLIESKARRS